jgi:demethylmenaquinone methyltransferase/2-methoxy-6-polyprenyl-1,4-benzoquinol methylase
MQNARVDPTEALLADQVRYCRAHTVLAVDVAAEMIEVAGPKISTSNVTFVQADVFTWSPGRRFDAIFFAFWLSHVTPAMFNRFWERLAAMVGDDGRVLAIDELPDRRNLEQNLTTENGLPVAQRQLRDGSAIIAWSRSSTPPTRCVLV